MSDRYEGDAAACTTVANLFVDGGRDQQAYPDLGRLVPELSGEQP